MPTVPLLNRPQVATAPLPSVRTNAAADPLAVVGAGLQVASGVLEVFEKERLKALDVRINASEVKARDLRTRILNDPKTGILSLRGENAFGSGETADAEWAKGISEIEAELSDPQARELFRARADALRSELRSATARHESGEREALDTTTTKALVEDSINAIAASAVDVGQVNVHLERATQLLDGRLQRQGIPKEVREVEVAQLRSAGRAAQLTAMANTEDEDVIAKAREIFAAEQGTMTERDREAVRRDLDSGDLLARAQKATDETLASFPDDEAAALASVREKYTGQLRDQVESRVKARFAEQAQQSNRADATTLETVMQKIERTGDMSGLTSSELSVIQRRGWVDNVQSRATQVRNGQPPVSEIGALEDIWKANREGTLRDIVPLTYRSRLNDRDYRMLNDAVTEAKTGGGGQNPATTQEQIDRYTFDGAKRLGMLDVADQAALKKDQKVTFEELRTAVAFEFDRERERLKRNLLPSELEQVVKNALYARAMFQRNENAPNAPRAPFAATEPVGSLRNIPPLRPNLTRADRGARSLELLAAGMSPDEAMAQVLREIP